MWNDPALAQFSATILLSIILSLALGRIGIHAARRLSMIDRPAETSYKIHTVPTPRAGGIILLLVFLAVGSITGILWDNPLRAIVLASLVIFIFGIYDDARRSNAATKLLGQLLAAAILMQGGVVSHILKLPILDGALTVFWLVGITNAYNLVDSMDGEALGLAVVGAGFLAIAMASTEQHPTALFGVIIVGACAGLLYHNVTPARLFLGDSGSQLLGFWLAALGIVFTPDRSVPQLSSWFVPILIMIVPILDTTLVTISRLRLRQPLYLGNRDHTYHRLAALGLSPQRAVLATHLTSVLAGCAALIALQLSPAGANAIFFGALAVGLAAIFLLSRVRVP